jgi:hypothetical protein
MNPTANKFQNRPDKKSKSVEKEVRKKLSQEDETLTLVDIAAGIDEVKKHGFGRVVVFIQNGYIYHWEQVKSRTRRKTKHNLTSFE